MGIILPSSLVDDYSDAKHERQPHGLIIVNGQEVATTLKCPHCGGHFVSRKGSGHRRTFCMACHAVTCGNRACDPHSAALNGMKHRLFGDV